MENNESPGTKVTTILSTKTDLIRQNVLFYRKKLGKASDEEKTKLIVEKDKQITEMNDLITRMKQEHSVTAESLR